MKEPEDDFDIGALEVEEREYTENDFLPEMAEEENAARRFDPDYDQRLFMTKLVMHKTGPNDIDELIRRGFNASSFSKAIKPKLEYVLNYYRDHKVIPNSRMLTKQFPGFAKDCLLTTQDQAVLVEQDMPLHALYHEVAESNFLLMAKVAIEQLFELWQDPNTPVEKYWETMDRYHRELAHVRSTGRSEAMTFAEATHILEREFDEAMTGRNWAIPIPFPFLYEALRGFQPAEVTTIVGRTGVGKTWAALMCAVVAVLGNPFHFTPASKVGFTDHPLDKQWRFNNRKRVLVVSLEMPIPQIARRLFALLSKLAYPEIRKGKFADPANEKLFRERIQQVRKSEWEIGENCLLIRATSPDAIAAYADSFQADLVIVDGFYLMGGTGEKRWERVQDNMAQMRVHSLMSGRHYVLVSQLAQKEEKLAFSQSIEQDSSNIIVLKQTEGERNSEKLRIGTRKVRDGTVGQEFYYTWSVVTPRFEQEGEASIFHDEDT